MKKLILILFYLSTIFANSVPQTPANTIQDKHLIIKAHDNKTFCLAPRQVHDRVIIGMLDCKQAVDTRYDLYKRLAFKYKDNWLCASLSDRFKSGQTKQDFFELKPCVLNDKSQWFSITDTFSLPAYIDVEVKESEYNLLATKNKNANKITIDNSEMKQWLQAVPPPINYALKTSIYFRSKSNNKLELFYITKNGASKTPFNFYYDITSGKIALFNPGNGTFECLETNLSNQDASFLKFSKCNFYGFENRFYWNLNLFENSYILDINKNILDVSRGSELGKLFISDINYYKTHLSPSVLLDGKLSFDFSVYELRNFNARNLGLFSSHCGAERRTKREVISNSLANFDPLQANWKARLLSIARTTDSSTDASGICGICMLHTYEIVSLLTQVYPHSPILNYSSTGYLFDYMDNVSPFTTFARRNPAMYNLMGEALELWGQQLALGEGLYSRGIRAIWALTSSILPRQEWSLSTITTQDNLRAQLRGILHSPAGSLYIALMSLDNGIAHAVPIIITNNGAVVIPTNAQNISEEDFESFIAPTHDEHTLLRNLSANNRYNIQAISLIGLAGNRDNIFEEYLNQFDCTGGGDFRRGNGHILNPNHADTCDNDRCDLMEIEHNF